MTVKASILALVSVAAIFAQPAMAQNGAEQFNVYCAVCHEGTSDARAPKRDALSKLSPQQIMAAMETGSMKAAAAERSRANG